MMIPETFGAVAVLFAIADRKRRQEAAENRLEELKKAAE
jgi:hypothetical protein